MSHHEMKAHEMKAAAGYTRLHARQVAGGRLAVGRHTVYSNGDALRQLIAVLAHKRRYFAEMIDA